MQKGVSCESSLNQALRRFNKTHCDPQNRHQEGMVQEKTNNFKKSWNFKHVFLIIIFFVDIKTNFFKNIFFIHQSALRKKIEKKSSIFINLVFFSGLRKNIYLRFAAGLEKESGARLNPAWENSVHSGTRSNTPNSQQQWYNPIENPPPSTHTVPYMVRIMVALYAFFCVILFKYDHYYIVLKFSSHFYLR